MNVVFSDIDGTFQEMGKPIPLVNLEAVQALQEKNDRFVFVSGRNYQQIQRVLTEGDLDCDVIFSNGAGYRLKGQEPQFTKSLTMRQVRFILETLEDHQLFYHVHTSHETYLKPMKHYQLHLQQLREALTYLGEQGKEIMNYKEAYFSNECQHHDGLINFFESHQEIKVLKVELMEGSDIKRKEVQKIFQEAGFSAFSTFVTGLEITDPTCNKGDAIKEYLEKFKGVKSYGIGDETNDLPMFAAVDVSVAVSNATEEVRAVCQVQARACNDGGVGHFINEVVLLKK